MEKYKQAHSSRNTIVAISIDSSFIHEQVLMASYLLIVRRPWLLRLIENSMTITNYRIRKSNSHRIRKNRRGIHWRFVKVNRVMYYYSIWNGEYGAMDYGYI